jgi:hypothetical protein
MSPARLPTSPGDRGQARARRRIAEKYLEVAELVSLEGGMTNNVCVGLAVLAGIAAGDAICLMSDGQRYSGQNHNDAATLLERHHRESGRRLHKLVGLKPESHYGYGLISDEERNNALAWARQLVAHAASATE